MLKFSILLTIHMFEFLYNWISEVNETEYLVQNEWWDGKCGFNESVCNSFQKRNQDKCRCGYKN